MLAQSGKIGVLQLPPKIAEYSMDANARSTVLISLEHKEIALVRSLLRNPSLLDSSEETVIRTAISVSRLHHIRTDQGELELEPCVLGLRDETCKLLEIAGVRAGSTPSVEKLAPVAKILRNRVVEALSQIGRICQGKVSWEQIDQEIRSRKLVVVAGGGGGVGYIYLGAFKFLADSGFTPSLIVGTSIGAVLGLCRAKHLDFDSSSFVRILRSLSWGKLFQPLSTKSRYGLPAALRFHLHSAIGNFFRRPDGTSLCLSDLPIPLVVTVSGIRSGVLPHPIEFYESLLEGIAGFPRPWFWARKIPQIISSFTELAQVSDRLQTINLGFDSGTENFDAVDAVGFSAALPGVLHYDLIRRDERMRAILDDMFLRHDLFRITDGFLVDNVPVRAAWQAVQRGLIGTRNALILALDGFAPRLSSPMWLAIQQLMATQVQKGIDHAHLYKGFSGTLSPLEAIPSVSSMVKMMERGKAELMSELPFLNRMLQPLAPLNHKSI